MIDSLKWRLRLCGILWDNRCRLVCAVVEEARKVLEREVFLQGVEVLLEGNEFIGKAGTA
jgi:hypothetical protein